MNKFYTMKKTADKTAEIMIYGDIGDGWWSEGVTAKQVKKDIAALGEVDHIDVRINSGGGSIYEGLAMFNALDQHDADVTTYNDGMAGSIASVILMSGNKIVMPPTSNIFIHRASGFAMGTAEEMRKSARNLDKMEKSAIRAYQNKTGMGKDELLELMDDDTMLDADEALELGFIDEISGSASEDNMKMAASFTYSFMGKVPEILRSGMKAPKKQKKQEVTTMTEAELKAKHPELFAAVLVMGRKEAEAEAATGLKLAISDATSAETLRIKGVFEQSLPGHEDKIQEMAFDGKTTGPEAAVVVLRLEQEKMGAMKVKINTAAPGAVPVTVASLEATNTENKDDQRPLDVICKEKWDGDANLRAEFQDTFGIYLKYEQNVLKGNCKSRG